MMEKKSAQVLIGAMNMLAVASSPLLLTSSVSYGAVSEQQSEQLNAASLKSIESSWLKVPKICKARVFNADPISLENKKVSSSIQAIYAAFGVS